MATHNLLVSQTYSETSNYVYFSIDGGSTWHTAIGKTMEEGDSVKILVREHTTDPIGYFWGWVDGFPGWHRNFTMGTDDVLISADNRAEPKPRNKIVLADTPEIVLMDLSISTITADPVTPEYDFNAVKEGVTYYDNTGILRTGTNPCTHVVDISTEPPAAGTPNYVFTIVTQQ